MGNFPDLEAEDFISGPVSISEMIVEIIGRMSLSRKSVGVTVDHIVRKRHTPEEEERERERK